MRPRCLFPLLIICGSSAGCFDDRGVALEIDLSASPTTKSVELFLSNDQCQDTDANCRSITPPQMPRLAGTIWHRDAPSRIFADVHGHKATLKLEAKDQTDTTISMLIAVATDGPDGTGAPVGVQTLTGLVVPANDSKVVTADLVATATLSPSNVAKGVLVWHTPDGAATPTSCVAVAQLDSDNNVERTLIVPDIDPDCDGKTQENDCVPNVYYDGTSMIGPDTNNLSATCAKPVDPTACVLGTLGCAPDDTADHADLMCRPQADLACLPRGVCDQCGGRPLSLCVSDVPHIDCRVPKSDVKGCDQDQSISLHVPASVDRCDNAELAVVGADNQLVFSKHADFAGVEIDIDVDKKTCELTLSWKGGAYQGPPPDLRTALIRIETGKGSVLIPLSVEFREFTVCTNGGDIAFECDPMSIANDASLWACLPP